jgi:hypothetical protein
MDFGEQSDHRRRRVTADLAGHRLVKEQEALNTWGRDGANRRPASFAGAGPTTATINLLL